MVWQETVNLPTQVTIGSIPITSTKCIVSLYAMAGRPLDPRNEASQTATRVLAKEHSTFSVTSYVKLAYGKRKKPGGSSRQTYTVSVWEVMTQREL